MRYAVIPLGPGDHDADLIEKLLLADKGAYTFYGPNVYFISFPGTAQSLSNLVGFSNPNLKEGKHGVVVSIGDYYGFGNKDLWSWLSSKE